MSTKTHFLNGQWAAGDGTPFESLCPVDQSVVWTGNEASTEQVDIACQSARQALGAWWNQPVTERIKICEAFGEIVKSESEGLANLIAQETGKPVWESKTEVGAVAGKVAVSVEAFRTRRDTTSFDMGELKAVTRFKPYGVCGVLGPFNFPAHLANGHIIPALIAGNTIVFKPSEQSPAVGAWMVEKWEQAGLPYGVLNLVQGGRDVGIQLTNHPELDGLFFTGSNVAGKAIHRAFADSPQKILALEMGGNNPLIVHKANNPRAAAYHTIMSAYVTAGQRCTCARRLIVVDNDDSRAFVDALVEMTQQIRVGFYSDQPEPFMGTVISGAQGRQLLEAQEALINAGGKSILKMESQRDCDALLSPGLIDVTEVERDDEELFGPLLNLIRVDSFQAAIDEANNTAYGLSAALLSDDRDAYDSFIHQIRAGIVNWNRQTTGATGRLPFGGCGLSGNNRPAAFYAADYCSFPTASLEAESLELPETPATGIEIA